jgi:hypothetical protein
VEPLNNNRGVTLDDVCDLRVPAVLPALPSHYETRVRSGRVRRTEDPAVAARWLRRRGYGVRDSLSLRPPHPPSIADNSNVCSSAVGATS